MGFMVFFFCVCVHFSFCFVFFVAVFLLVVCCIFFFWFSVVLIFGFCIWLFSMVFFLRARERHNMKLDKSGDEKDLRGLGDRKCDQNILYGKYNIFQMRTLLI